MTKRLNQIINGAVMVGTSLVLVGLVARGAQADDGKQIFEKNCGSCHGPTGKGDGPASKMLKPPPADLSTAIKGVSDDDLLKIVKDGGKAAGKSALMPAYGAKLSADQLKDVLQYVKGFAGK